MKIFSYIAEQSFKTSPNGERLFFHPGTFWSSPYIVPNPETEKQLFKKLLWMSRVSLGALIVIALLLQPIRGFIITPLGFVLLFLGTMSLFFFVSWLIFRKDLQTLQRTTSRFPIFDLRDSAKRRNTPVLILGLLGCIMFVCVGSSMITNPSSAFIGWISIIFFGFGAILGSCTLLLKLLMLFDKKAGKGKTEA